MKNNKERTMKAMEYMKDVVAIKEHIEDAVSCAKKIGCKLVQKEDRLIYLVKCD